MNSNISDLSKVLDPWLEKEPSSELRAAVISKLIWLADNFDEVSSWSAEPGQHPLRREIEVDEGALITIVLGNPVRASRLLSIDTLD